jgi:hypothetical protein
MQNVNLLQGPVCREGDGRAVRDDLRIRLTGVRISGRSAGEVGWAVSRRRQERPAMVGAASLTDGHVS